MQEALNNLVQLVGGAIPTLIGARLILLFGWLIAWVAWISSRPRKGQFESRPPYGSSRLSSSYEFALRPIGSVPRTMGGAFCIVTGNGANFEKDDLDQCPNTRTCHRPALLNPAQLHTILEGAVAGGSATQVAGALQA